MHVVLVEYPCKCRHLLLHYLFYYSVASPGKDLMGQQDALDQEIASQKSERRRESPQMSLKIVDCHLLGCITSVFVITFSL